MLFEKWNGRKRNVGGGVLAGFLPRKRKLAWGKPKETRRFNVSILKPSDRGNTIGLCLGLVKRNVVIEPIRSQT